MQRMNDGMQRDMRKLQSQLQHTESSLKSQQKLCLSLSQAQKQPDLNSAAQYPEMQISAQPAESRLSQTNGSVEHIGLQAEDAIDDAHTVTAALPSALPEAMQGGEKDIQMLQPGGVADDSQQNSSSGVSIIDTHLRDLAELRYLDTHNLGLMGRGRKHVHLMSCCCPKAQ